MGYMVYMVLSVATVAVSGALEQEEEECEGKEGFFPHQEQCDKYYQCKDNRLSSHFCPDGLMYDSSHFKASFQLDSSGTTGKCSYPFSIDCSGREQLQPPTPSEGCPRKNGYFAHQDCDKYYFCNDGAANLYDCPGGLVFAPDKGQCTWTQEANRPGCRSKEKSKFSCPEVGPSEHPRYSDPEDCQKFYVCISGSAHHNSCSKGLVFHPLTLACDRQESVDGPCSSWYNQTAVEGLTLPDALPTPATARPVRGKSEAFLNRRRPPTKSSNVAIEDIKVEIPEKLKADLTLKRIRGRTRVRGSVLRPVHQQNVEKSTEGSNGLIRRQPQRRRNPEDTISVEENTEREGPPLSKTEALPVKSTRPRVRTRTRISSASLPNKIKGEQSVSQERTRVRGRVNIRQN